MSIRLLIAGLLVMGLGCTGGEPPDSVQESSEPAPEESSPKAPSAEEEADEKPSEPVAEPEKAVEQTPEKKNQAKLLGFLNATKALLEREPVAELVKVRHVLLSWRQLSPAYKGKMDPRGAERTKEQANALAVKLFQELQGGAPILEMMKEHSEDPGSAAKGTSYTVTPSAGFVPPFKNASLRLKVGESVLIESIYGWHLIQRAE